MGDVGRDLAFPFQAANWTKGSPFRASFLSLADGSG
jgi:hypothetical protein